MSTHVRFVAAAAAFLLASAAHARAPVTAPPPPRIELTPQQREARDQACRDAVSRMFISDSPEHMRVWARRAEADHRIRSVLEIITSNVLELRVYVVAMARFDLAPDWLGSQPFYFQCSFGVENEIVAVEVI